MILHTATEMVKSETVSAEASELAHLKSVFGYHNIAIVLPLPSGQSEIFGKERKGYFEFDFSFL